MDKEKYAAFKEKLDLEHKWPTDYMFKFICPTAQLENFIAQFPEIDFIQRASKAGNYVSLTATLALESSEEVVNIYHKAYQIEGLIAL